MQSFRPLGVVNHYAIDNSGAVVEAEGAHVQVQVIAGDLVRVRMACDGRSDRQGRTGRTGPSESRSYAVIQRDWPQVDVKAEDGPDEIRLATDEILVSIRKSPLRIGFLRPDGAPVCLDHPGSGMGWRGQGAGCWKVLRPREHFYGFGERTGYLDKRGQAMTLWNIDTNPHTPSTDSMYVSIPFFLALGDGRAYGILLNSSAKCFFDMGKTSPDSYLFATDEKALDYYFFAGPNMKDILTRYADLTGRMQLPPLWALGYHQSRYSYHPQGQVEEIARAFREHDIPCDAIYLDIHYMRGFRVFTFDPKEFPDPSGLIGRLNRLGFKVVTIVDPGVKVDPEYDVYRDGVDQDCFVALPGGKRFVASVWPGAASFPDFAREKVRKWWAGWHKVLFDAGVRGIWNDMNEPSCFDTPTKTMATQALHGEPGDEVPHSVVHNAYANLMSEATCEAFRQLLPGVRPFVISRAGCAGIQRHACVWTGDNSSWWEHLLMAVPMCLNLGMSGVSFVGTDVGGFLFDSDPELVTRWTQLGAFTPLFRNHSAIGTRPQEPFVLGEPYESICRSFIKLRYRLLPYIYSLVRESSIKGVPVMRPMVLEFPDDEKAHTIFDQFMLGPDILVAPVYQPGADCRKIYLPAGEWLDFYTGETLGGGRNVLADAPLERIPLFYRRGAIVPYGREMSFVGEIPQALDLVDVCPSEGSPARAFELYLDDGETTGYRSGKFGFVDISYEMQHPATLDLAVDTRDQGYACVLPLGTLRIWSCQERPTEVLVGSEPLRPAQDAREVLGGLRAYFLDLEKHHLYVGVHSTTKNVKVRVAWPPSASIWRCTGNQTSKPS
ncbi:MAG: glycoside hydrolase family 31 protein [Bacillota bacterium]